LALRSYSTGGGFSFEPRLDERAPYSHHLFSVQPARRFDGYGSVRSIGVGLLLPTIDTRAPEAMTKPLRMPEDERPRPHTQRCPRAQRYALYGLPAEAVITKKWRLVE